MPCDIGYKSFSKAKIVVPEPQRFKKKVEAPKIDADLLERIGSDDPVFAEWLEDLNIVVLLDEALTRALAKVGSGGVNFKINSNGFLEADSEYKNPRQKKEIEKKIDSVNNQWQLELFVIIAKLLDYEVVVNQSGENAWTIEGEKNETSSVHKYLKIKKSADDSEIVFEHFESKKSLEKEFDKFFGLAQKLGAKISLTKTKISGSPISAGTTHRHFLGERS